jgi:hypothetical protein
VRWTGLSAVAILLTSAVAFLANYDPLCHQQCGGISGVSGPTVQLLGNFTSPTGDDFSAWRVMHSPGQEFSFWLTLSNEGPVGITVTRVGDAPQQFDRFSVVRVQTQPESGQPPLRDFRPFSLKPSSNEVMDVLVTMRMQSCVEGGTSYQFGSIPVTYRVLGITRRTTVFLRSSIAVTGAPGTTCPN